MKVMISQPMRGKTEEQIRAERQPIVEELEARGIEIVDTIFAETPEKAQNAPLFYLAKSVDALSKVDGVVFIGNWYDARGCRIEHEIAESYGLFIRHYHGPTPDTGKCEPREVAVC